jgi:dephospho-CoA kinase
MTAFRLGLTGSIGMGKSTTAAIFAAQGVPVWDADGAVHRLYAAGGEAVEPVASLCPEAAASGAIDRTVLRKWIADDPAALGRLEAVVHPLVARDRAEWLSVCKADLVLLDIPLLFETGLEQDVDATLVVTAPPDMQRARVMARPGMTATLFDTLLAKQLPDREKRSRATHIIETLSLESVEAGVRALIAYLGSGTNA